MDNNRGLDLDQDCGQGGPVARKAFAWFVWIGSATYPWDES